MVKEQEAQRSHTSFRVMPKSPRLLHEKAESEQETEISIQGLHSSKGEDLNGFTTRNHSISSTKKTTLGLIKRYKSYYSQKGVIQKHSGRKRLVVRRYGWSRTSQILFLHLFFSLICFATKTMQPPQKLLKPREWLQQSKGAFPFRYLLISFLFSHPAFPFPLSFRPKTAIAGMAKGFFQPFPTIFIPNG